jgi:histidinol dehydrogenase
MIPIYDGTSTSYEAIFSRVTEPMEGEGPTTAQIQEDVRRVLSEVKARGDDALRDYTRKWDGVLIEDFLVSSREMEEAKSQVSSELLDIMEEAATNIRAFHQLQRREDYELKQREGARLGQKTLPIERVGIYVPGGTASYPSSVLMNAIPATIAGVSQIVMITPPGKDGAISPVILAAAQIAGVTRVYKVGGAQGIGALAFGTETVPKVDKITGPGNIYVATAKKMVFGEVDIDMVAGPSEILILADHQANPAYVAADLLSQAEHDVLAASVLLTPSRMLAEAVVRELEDQMARLPRGETARESMRNRGKIVVTQSLEQAMEWSNRYAPEHLELALEDPFSWLDKVKNAGAVFLGHHVPEALGDYFAGTNHVLPTGGTARFSSPLSVEDFQKKINYIYYTKEALEKVKDRIVVFAQSEGLEAHGRSVAIRFEKDWQDE